MYAWLRYCRPNRRRSSGHTSHSGRPSTIHSRHHLADAARAREPVRADRPRRPRSPGTSDSPRRKSASGVNASGPLKNIFTSAVSIAGTRRIAFSNSSSHPVPVLRKQLRLEALRDAVERPRRRLALVAAHDEAADLGAEVDEVVGVAQRRQRLERRVERLGDEVLVPERDDRQVDADEPRELRRVHAGRVDDDLALDRAPDRVSTATTRPSRVSMPVTRRPHLDLRAEPARRVGERERQLARVEVAVVGDVRRGEHAVRAHRREQRLRLVAPRRSPSAARTSSPTTAWRRISSSRGCDEASRRPPSWRQPGSFPVSSFSSA